MAYKWKPSKTAINEFKNQMEEIDIFCYKNNIQQSSTSDSYYFTIDNKSYRVSNHSVEASFKNSHGKYHTEGREEEIIYIHASKTRLIEIYERIKAGYEVDGRGNVKVK